MASPRREAHSPRLRWAWDLPLESGLPMDQDSLTGALARAAERSFAREAAGLEGFAESRFRSCRGLGGAPAVVVLSSSGEASTVYGTAVQGQLAMQAAENLFRYQLGPNSRALQLTSAPDPSLDVAGALGLLAAGVPFIQPDFAAGKDVSWLADAVSRHRATTLSTGPVHEPGGKPWSEVAKMPDTAAAMLQDFRSLSLGMVPPPPLQLSTDWSSGAAALMAERVVPMKGSQWTLGTGTGALPKAEMSTWKASQDCGRLLHFAWEPPALAAEALSEAELVLTLAAARGFEAKALTTLGEGGFFRTDSGRARAADDMGSLEPARRRGLERLMAQQRVQSVAPEPDAAPSREAQNTRALAAPEQPSPAKRQDRRPAVDMALVRQQMATVVDEAVGALLNVSEIPADQSLMEVGLNSMHAAQLRDIIYGEVGSSHVGMPPLPATMVFDYPTKAAIADFIANQIATLAGPAEASPEAAREEPKDAAGSRADAEAKRRQRQQAAILASTTKYQEILNYTQTVIAEVVGKNILGDDVPLMNVGVNSMHAAQLRDFLQAETREKLGLRDLHLPATLVFDFPTTAAIAGLLHQQLGWAEDTYSEGEARQARDHKLQAEESEEESGGIEGEPAWCVARAKRQLRTGRKGTGFHPDISFYHLLEAPVLEAALAGISDRSSVLEADTFEAVGEIPRSAEALAESALAKLCTGYVKGEGRLFAALHSDTGAEKGFSWVSELRSDVYFDDEVKRRNRSRNYSGMRREALASHRYGVSGSWSKWKDVKEMDPTDNDMFVCMVILRGGETEEFQILQDGDWSKVFFPPPGPFGANGATTMGPGVAHGRNFFIKVPPGEDRRCTFAFSPLVRRLTWKLWASESAKASASSSSDPPAGYAADPVGATAQMAAEEDGSGGGGGHGPRDAAARDRWRHTRFQPAEGYYLVGNWDSWSGFTKLIPEKKEELVYKADISVAAGEQVEFQVVADRDTSKRYVPRRKVHMRVAITGGRTIGIAGPTDLPSLHWVLQAPRTCRILQVTWNPEGEMSLRWEFK